MGKFLSYMVLTMMPVGILALVGLAIWTGTGVYDMSSWMSEHEMKWHLIVFWIIACCGVAIVVKTIYDGVVEYYKFVKWFIQTRNAPKG